MNTAENNFGYEVPADEEQPARVTVTTPCTCGVEHRWFQCGSRLIVAEYKCHGLIDLPLKPHPDAIKEIEKLHPGMDLIYIG